jgi:hypothetical protein
MILRPNMEPDSQEARFKMFSMLNECEQEHMRLRGVLGHFSVELALIRKVFRDSRHY